MGIDFRFFARTAAVDETGQPGVDAVPTDTPDEPEEQPDEGATDGGTELPPSCSYCGSSEFEPAEDNGRIARAKCSACGGTMVSHDGGYWQPDLIGSPHNHPKTYGDPSSGGVGGIWAPVLRTEDLTRTAMPSMKHSPPEGLRLTDEGYDPSDDEHADLDSHLPGWDHRILRAHMPGRRNSGHLEYSVDHDHDGVHPGLVVNLMGTQKEFRSRGIASAMQDHLRSLYPTHVIEHGGRTTDGQGWWGQYQDPAPHLDYDNPAHATHPEHGMTTMAGMTMNASLADPEVGFHLVATWADVRNKAKRIRAEGGVHIVVSSVDGIGGNVQGDTGVYETILSYRLGSTKVSAWQCGCAWAAYAFNRSPAFKRFEGRMCSHALALQFEAQSRGMFGNKVLEDVATRPTWLRDKARSRYDRDTGRHDLVNASLHTADVEGVYPSDHGLDLVRAPIYAFAVTALAKGADPSVPMAAMLELGMAHSAAREVLRDAMAGYDPYGEWDGREDDEESEAHSKDWDDIHSGIESLHRGVGVMLHPHDHAIVHDPHRPVPERAQHLISVMQRHTDEPGIGTHWTPSRSVAEDFSDDNVARHLAGESKRDHMRRGDHTWGHDPDGDPKGQPATSVVFHAHRPDRDVIDEHPDEMAHGSSSIYGFHDHGEHEVPIRPGSSMDLKGISWKAKHDDYDEPADHDDAYTHHDFGGEGHHVTATLARTAAKRCPDCGSPVPPDASFCPHCHAALNDDDAGLHMGARRCPTCHGAGEVEHQEVAFDDDGREVGTHTHKVRCEDCDGSGSHEDMGADEQTRQLSDRQRAYEQRFIDHAAKHHANGEPIGAACTPRWCPLLRQAAKDDSGYEAPTHAGLALKAADTGRVLMLQRSNKDEADPARGTWEFPGGGIEDHDHNSLHGAMREFAEEVGQPVPQGGTLQHVHRNNNYVLHTMVIPREDQITLHDGRIVPNPDDPEGGDAEQAAWWHPEHAQKNPALREECKSSPWKAIKEASRGTTAGSSDWRPGIPTPNLNDPEHARMLKEENEGIDHDDLATSPTITRGIKLSSEFHPDVAKRISEGKATLPDLMPHMHHDVGEFWHGHHNSLEDAKDYAGLTDDHVGHELGSRPYEGEHGGPVHMGDVGVVLEAHRPKGWDPNQNPDDGQMGNSYLAHPTTLNMHKIHYNDERGHWHHVDATGTTMHTDGAKSYMGDEDGSYYHQEFPDYEGADHHRTATFSSNDPLGDFAPNPVSPGHNTPLPGDQENPASTGFATGGDPDAFRDADSRNMSMPTSFEAAMRQGAMREWNPGRHYLTKDDYDDHMDAHFPRGSEVHVKRFDVDDDGNGWAVVDHPHGEARVSPWALKRHEQGGPDDGAEKYDAWDRSYDHESPGQSQHLDHVLGPKAERIPEQHRRLTEAPGNDGRMPWGGHGKTDEHSHLGQPWDLSGMGHEHFDPENPDHHNDEWHGGAPLTPNGLPIRSMNSLHEGPEPALPSTDGGDDSLWDALPDPAHEHIPLDTTLGRPDPRDDMHPEISDLDATTMPNQVHASVDDIVARFQATAGGKALGQTGGGPDDASIAEAAKAHLAKTALKDFSHSERQELIGEGAGVKARNFGDLQIEGTHYENIEAALAAHGDPDDVLII